MFWYFLYFSENDVENFVDLKSCFFTQFQQIFFDGGINMANEKLGETTH